ncbi:Uncharacterised protein [Salmonella enterica subsp. enterica serovar Typhi]|nr:Uncharacterised protein [Salmonella enterica subsp. enterica serovar Typhi]CHE50616.1 Uncharacterised protein [Salmonella enterica subsp. enterica serovar Typhi]
MLLFQHLKRLAEAGDGCGVEFIDRAWSIEHQFGDAIFQPVEVQGVAFIKHVSLLNPQGDLVVSDEAKCVFCVNKMQIND